MKYTQSRMTRFATMLALGMVNGNTAPISFAGAPNNFNYAAGSGVPGAQTPAPLAGTNGVPNPAPVMPHSLSKVNPGVNSTSTPDPNTPAALVNGLPTDGSSALAPFAKLFDNSPKLDAQGKPVVPAKTVLDANVSNYQEMAKNLKFGELMNPEQQAALVAGGEGAVAALSEVLNNFGQQIFAQAAATATQVTKKGFEVKASENQAAINEAIRLHGLSNSLLNKDSRLADPAVAPLVSVVQQQMAKAFPQDTVAQLETKVVSYFENAFSGFGGKKQEEVRQQQAAAKPAFNFLEFLQKRD
jgi:hypothetical protein